MQNPQVDEWLEKMQRSGDRLTGPRYVVAEVLSQSERALTAQEVYDLARQNYPTLGLVSVYRTIDRMESLGLIQRVHLPEKCRAYLAAFSGHEHMIVCNQCGQVVFFQGDDLSSLEQRVEKESGYRVDTHWLQFFGLCQSCQEVGSEAY